MIGQSLPQTAAYKFGGTMIPNSTSSESLGGVACSYAGLSSKFSATIMVLSGQERIKQFFEVITLL
jgi:hypothetical protein